jgi:hypothetical protein
MTTATGRTMSLTWSYALSLNSTTSPSLKVKMADGGGIGEPMRSRGTYFPPGIRSGVSGTD